MVLTSGGCQGTSSERAAGAWPFVKHAAGAQQTGRGTVVTVWLNFPLGMEKSEPEPYLGQLVADVHPNVPGHF